MSLITSVGPLADLDIDSVDQLKSILAQDKTRMLEGLVIERVFQQYLGSLASRGIVTLPISLVRAKRRKSRQGVWWIWDHGGAAADADVLQQRLEMGSEESVIQCLYDSEQRNFLVKRWKERSNFPLQQFLLKKRKLSEPVFLAPDESVKDQLRAESAFWSGIFGHDARRLFNDVVLHRLFKNCAIQPFFDYLWDIDNLVRLPCGTFLQLEVKHKYPYQGRRGLRFGINRGQLLAMKELASRGINTLHLIMVKPRWIKDTGTTYLLQNGAERKRVMMIAHYLDQESIEQALHQERGWSSREESWTGQTQVTNGVIPVSKFQLLGTPDDPFDQVAHNIGLAMTNQLDSPVTDELLKSNRILE